MDEKEEKEPSCSSSSSSSRVRMNVIDALQSHPHLQHLLISKYKVSKLPGWMSSPHAHLQKVYLSECHHLAALPSVWSLPWLDEMCISQMGGLRVLGREFLGLTTAHSSSSANVIFFRNLQYLYIHECYNLEEWEDITAEEEASAATLVMPYLNTLMIIDCNGLAKLPHRLLWKLQQRYVDKDGSDWKSISENNPRLQLQNES